MGLNELKVWLAWLPAFVHCTGIGLVKTAPGARLVGDNGVMGESDD
jgi:hypothetical protein